MPLFYLSRTLQSSLREAAKNLSLRKAAKNLKTLAILGKWCNRWSDVDIIFAEHWFGASCVQTAGNGKQRRPPGSLGSSWECKDPATWNFVSLSISSLLVGFAKLNSVWLALYGGSMAWRRPVACFSLNWFLLGLSSERAAAGTRIYVSRPIYI